MDMARPRIIKSPGEFDALVDLYVEQCRIDEEPMSTVGLALALGFCDKASLYDYGQIEEFSASVKRARSIVERSYVRSALKGGGAGPIFLLKASYGYKETQAVEVTGKNGGPIDWSINPVPTDAKPDDT